MKITPARFYSVAVYLVALGAYFAPSDAWPLVLGALAAATGVGQAVERRQLRSDLGRLDVLTNSIAVDSFHAGMTANQPTQGAPTPPPTAPAQGRSHRDMDGV